MIVMEMKHPCLLSVCVRRVSEVPLQGWTANRGNDVSAIWHVCRKGGRACPQESSNTPLMRVLIKISTSGPTDLWAFKKKTELMNRQDITSVVLQFYWLQKQSKNKLLFPRQKFGSEPFLWHLFNAHSLSHSERTVDHRPNYSTLFHSE